MENIYSASKLAFHQEKLKALERKEITAPLYIRIKPTNKCDHNCFYCSYNPEVGYILSERFDRKDEIPKEKMMEILNDFKEMGVKALTYSGGGEPLIYSHIEKTLEKTLENNIELSIITNGQKLNGKRAELLTQAEWVRVSANACDVETFAKIRRIPTRFFYELKANLENFAKTKKPDCEFGVDFVITAENKDRVYEITKFFKQLGLNNVKFSPMWIPRGFHEYHVPFKQKVIEQIKKAQQDLQDNTFTIYDNYEGHFNFGGVEKRKYERCFMIEVLPVIAADCCVYTCQDKAYSSRGLLGSIKNRSFKDLWFSEEMNQRIKNFDPKKECCHHCSKDLRNISIQQMLKDLGNIDKYKPKSEKHKNFI